MHVTRSPRPSSAVFHTGSDQILAVERQGNEAKVLLLSTATKSFIGGLGDSVGTFISTEHVKLE